MHGGTEEIAGGRGNTLRPTNPFRSILTSAQRTTAAVRVQHTTDGGYYYLDNCIGAQRSSARDVRVRTPVDVVQRRRRRWLRTGRRVVAAATASAAAGNKDSTEDGEGRKNNNRADARVLTIVMIRVSQRNMVDKKKKKSLSIATDNAMRGSSHALVTRVVGVNRTGRNAALSLTFRHRHDINIRTPPRHAMIEIEWRRISRPQSPPHR